MITDIGNLAAAWWEKYSKWYTCSMSNVGDVIELYDWDVTETVSEVSIIGGTEINGPGCFMFAEWNDWAPNLLPLMRVGASYAGIEMPDFMYDIGRNEESASDL